MPKMYLKQWRNHTRAITGSAPGWIYFCPGWASPENEQCLLCLFAL